MSEPACGSVASHHYFDRDFDRMAVKLLPCEYYVTTNGTALLTVLGSCVAACLHDPVAKVAGMNHFMLPDDGEPGGQGGGGTMRYGAPAMDVLLQEVLRAGARRERLQAKVFGGAAVLPNMPTLNVGDRNADFVLRYLHGQGIEVTGQDLGGPYARRVCFLPDSGKVVVRRLPGQQVEHLQREERDLQRRLARGGEPAPTSAFVALGTGSGRP